jgi:WD40 repeat protein
MRRTLFLTAFLFASTLAAQGYLQNNIPVQQTLPASDCYTRNLDNGNAALRRGEAREALRFFNLAKDCPEAIGNTRRQAELDSRIIRCTEQLPGYENNRVELKPLDATTAKNTSRRTFSSDISNARRNYSANRNLLKDTLDDCFYRIVDEADRAYRLKFWEDAAALYRAAKNCNDADQKNRQEMSQKIIACRNAAENELFAKQQEAERQARHAIAANLADDAQEILRTTDRSLAFRLADFANQFIAPEDNPDCVQAMFDAWYFQPSENSKHRKEELYRPVLCYELAENLGENAQIKFERKRNGSHWLWAFKPKTGQVYAWELPSMKLMHQIETGEGARYEGFDLSPTGDQLFWGNNYFELRRGANEHRIPVPRTANWCFSTRGDELFYENVSDQKIYFLKINDIFEQQLARKGAKNTNMVQKPVVAQEIVSGIQPGLMAMQYVGGKFWLGYRDRVEILSKEAAGKPWRREKTVLFDQVNIPNYVDQKDIKLVLHPEYGFAFIAIAQGCWTIPISLNPSAADSNLVTREFKNMYPLAVSAKTQKAACIHFGNYQYDSFWLLDAFSGDTLLRQRIPDFTGFDLLEGSFSEDGQWVAASSVYGTLIVWALRDAPTVETNQLSVLPGEIPRFSPSGTHLSVSTGDTLMIFNTERPKRPAHVWAGKGLPWSGTSDHWALLQITPDSVEARHLADGRKLRFPCVNPEFTPYLYTFDPTGQLYVAYLTDWSKIEVRSLKNGALLTSKTFEGGTIQELSFIPETKDLLIVQQKSMSESFNTQSSVKVWSPLVPGSTPRTPRLHDYPIYRTALEPSGQRVAFSNGSDIRIFDLKNLENEVLKIRTSRNNNVEAIAFRPFSNQIAAAYTDGNVIFWDTLTGQSVLHLRILPEDNLLANGAIAISIGFNPSGTVLQVATTDGRVLRYALDPSYIRAEAQSGNKQLQSFSVDHIVRYGLESALYYPGNFERLAESDDAPLVRTFLQYFGGQASESNNIIRVRDYCERAFYLYEKLSESNQKIWKMDMLRMYESYAWKLILRNNIREATAVAAFIKRQFDDDPQLLNAHLSLLNGDCSNASTLYSQYFLMSEADIPYPYESSWKFEQTASELTQLTDYKVIDSVQIQCFCGIVQYANAFENLCPKQATAIRNVLSPTDKLRWMIFENREASSNTLKIADKIKLLGQAHEHSKNLASLSAAKGEIWEETIRLELAQTYLDWARFERHSPEALTYFEQTLKLLTEKGAFNKVPDTSRLSLITSNYLTWGTLLLEANKNAEAAQKLNLGLEAIGQLSVLVHKIDSTRLNAYYDHLAGPLFEKLGTAFLLEGYAKEARDAYEQAGIYFVTYGLNTLYQANVEIFEGDETSALINYGNIFAARQTAEVFYILGRLGEKFPEQRARLEAFAPRLHSGLLSKNPRLVNAEADYWLAALKTDHFAAQGKWDSAVVWSRAMLKTAKECTEMPNIGTNWVATWLDGYINLSYYLLLAKWDEPSALDACIRLVEEATAFLDSKEAREFYYQNRELLKTNHAHALILRNGPGDRDAAIALYRDFYRSYADSRGYDNWELLEKDFRDLKRLGAPWPDLPELEAIVRSE